MTRLNFTYQRCKSLKARQIALPTLLMAHIFMARKQQERFGKMQALRQSQAKSPIDTLGVRTFEFLSDNKFKWIINTGTGAIPITFNITSAKVLRYTIESTASRTMYGFGQNVIRLTSFPTTGSFLDLYWDEGRKLYVSQDGKIIIKKYWQHDEVNNFKPTKTRL